MKKMMPDAAEKSAAEEVSTEKVSTTPQTEGSSEEASEPKTLKDGMELVYAHEDSGRNLPHLGLALEPGYLYVVGEDFDGAFGQRLVETGICRLAADEPKPDEPEAVVAEDKGSKDEAPKNEQASIQEMVKAEVTRELAEHEASEQHQDAGENAETETAEHQS